MPRGRIVTLCSGSPWGSTVDEQRVAALVVGRRPLLLGGHDQRFALGAEHDAVAGVLEVDPLDLLRATPDGDQCRFVDEVGEVGTGHAGGRRGHGLEVDVGTHPLVAAVHLEDRLALVVLGQRDDDLAVEAAGAQQRRVEDVGPVRGRHDDDALGGLEAVHLGQHLVERLLALVVPAAETGATLAADRVDLVDEDDRLAHPAGLLEQVADAAGADADEHLHEVGTGDRQEADAGLTGDGAGEQGLAGAGRADEQHALGDAGADLAEPLGHAQEVDDLGDLLLDAFVAGDVGERGRRLVGRVGLGLALADRHHVAHLAGGTALHPDEEADDQEHRAAAGRGC